MSEIKVEAARLNMGPIGFHVYARKFLEAIPPPSKEYSPVPYYCVCRALELALKAFLSANGVSSRKLKSKKFGHDLLALWNLAREYDLARHYPATALAQAELAKANVCYAEKGFEYFQLRFMMRNEPPLPSLELLTSMARDMLQAIRQSVVDASQNRRVA